MVEANELTPQRVKGNQTTPQNSRETTHDQSTTLAPLPQDSDTASEHHAPDSAEGVIVYRRWTTCANERTGSEKKQSIYLIHSKQRGQRNKSQAKHNKQEVEYPRASKLRNEETGLVGVPEKPPMPKRC